MWKGNLAIGTAFTAYSNESTERSASRLVGDDRRFGSESSDGSNRFFRIGQTSSRKRLLVRIILKKLWVGRILLEKLRFKRMLGFTVVDSNSVYTLKETDRQEFPAFSGRSKVSAGVRLRFKPHPRKQNAGKRTRAMPTTTTTPSTGGVVARRSLLSIVRHAAPRYGEWPRFGPRMTM